QSAFTLSAVTLALVVGFDVATVPLLLALQALTGAVQGIDMPARLAFVPELVPKDDLINAVALNSTLFNAARLVGPAVAGGIFLATAGPTSRAALNSVE